MRHLHLSLLLLLLFTACEFNKNETDTINGKPFSLEQTTSLLTEMQVFESVISTHRFYQDIVEQKMVFQAILEKYKFTQKDYDSTLTYLGNHLVLYQEILDSVKINIEKMEKIDLPYLKDLNTSNKADKLLPHKKR